MRSEIFKIATFMSPIVLMASTSAAASGSCSAIIADDALSFCQGDDGVTAGELAGCLRNLDGSTVAASDISVLMHFYDRDNDGTITAVDFIFTFFPNDCMTFNFVNF